MSQSTDTPNADRGLAGDTEFSALVVEMVADQAPRVFAVVHAYGDCVGAEIVAWGMAFDDGAYVTTVDGCNQYSLQEPENALNYIRGGDDVTVRLLWADS
ncbi:hypothetical protein JOF56_010200 [Kibdelosporangium banguiense]|uniref:Uncharacterized protein n=1 Tax=Kibdelosporangium banguiense TaxID=1365924 RepID=A0ABS4TZI2_9PSEU|nr:hypothetical protein [Kibdelosporangium banguiense]MBP2329815.1 hypothetical protein [Kibdelosporangium banguiense]